MILWIKKYFAWLHNNAPTGDVEIYPTLSESYQSSVPGIFVIGDLTGVPLLKFAVESGKKVWKSIPRIENDLLDAIIIGAGPSGISAALEAQSLGRKALVLEANSAFQTIASYPKAKPIFAEPKEFHSSSALQIENGTKETLLGYLKHELEGLKLPFFENERVESVIRNAKNSVFEVKTESGKSYNANHIIIAMGKSGDPRKLSIPGEDKAHVFYRLLDPAETKDKSVLIVGGGDSAIEAAIATSRYARNVTLVHRGDRLARPKFENLQRFQALIGEGKIQFFPGTKVREILDSQVLVESEKAAKKVSTDFVLVQIGTDPPLSFLKKLGLQIQNSNSIRDWIGFFSILSFAITAYFGKASFYGISWYSSLATVSAGAFLIGSFVWLAMFLRQNGFKKPSNWNLFRNLYLISASCYFLFVYLSASYFDFLLLGKYPSFHYTFLYSMTILVFGIRRMTVRPTSYIKLQTYSLIFVQCFFLFLLPEILLPFLGESGLLGSTDGFLLTQVFPNKAYWKAYGFILAWPLSMGVLYDGSITNFWLGYGLFITFGVIPFLVYKFGKGAYCGWICSCGGLAETLGDEQRSKMPHGKWAYKLEHSGQWILLFAFLLTIFKLAGVFGKGIFPQLVFLEYSADSIKWMYDLVVDIGLAGVLGVGCYFFLSGRIWCRMFCPLASLMHIYAKFSRFRIFSDKKKCISCNICTKNCHQGIDVMGYANKGIPMDSVQCVRCSACVSLCPTQVLSFGHLSDGKEVLERLQAVL
jgi:NosR/NirI family nitrous oxide reductase transcriptional regulator